MERKNFLLTLLATIPFFSLTKNNSSERTGTGFKINSGESKLGRHFKMNGITQNVLDVKISGNDLDNGMVLFEQTGLTPKGGPPLHIHPFQDEWFYVLEGEYRFQVGDITFYGKTGDTIFLPRNVPHAFIQLSDRGRMLVAYQPAGKMENFFEETSKWAYPPSKEEIARVMAKYDMLVAGPPLSAN